MEALIVVVGVIFYTPALEVLKWISLIGLGVAAYGLFIIWQATRR